LLVATTDDLASGRIHETPQDEAASTYAPRLTKDDGMVVWSLPAAQVHDLIRGLHPWPHAFTFHQRSRFILRRSIVSVPGSEGSARDEAPGTIVEAAGDQLVVATGAGRLRLTEIQAEGKRPMSVREFLAGHPLTAGALFTEAPGAP
jgi:methionyl-tRNA formyltransferase